MSVITDILKASETAEPLDTVTKGSGFYTAYGIHTLINKTLLSVGASPEALVSPQLMYNYASQGLIDGNKSVKGEKKRYPEAVVVAFVARFVKGRAATLLENFEDPEIVEADETDENSESENADETPAA